jgi:SAM-dependent methyltransferase
MPMKATDPRQYDSPQLDWREMGEEYSPSRVWFREILEDLSRGDSFTNARVLDIGSGIGQLFNWLTQKGAAYVTGIDPSERNIETSKTLYPWAESIQTTLQDFNAAERYDSAIAIMVFEHISDMHAAFGKINELLKDTGIFYLIIGDKDYHTSPREEVIEFEIIQTLPRDAVETRTIYKEENGKQAPIYDIFRPVETVIESASDAGFSLMQHILVPPERPICHALKFQKKEKPPVPGEGRAARSQETS